MQSRFLLDVVIRKCATIFKLFSGKDQSLLIRRNTFLILYFSLHIGDSVGGLNIKCDRLSSKCFHKDLHASSETQNQVES